MKRRFLAVIALVIMSAMTLSSCAIPDIFNQWFGNEVELTDAPLQTEKIADFTQGAPDASVLYPSHGWSNGDVFNVVWQNDNVYYEDGIMRLGIVEEPATVWIDGVEVPYSYTAGEARTENYYHYGDYEVRMKPSANPGTASTFFVCTGPYDLKDGEPNPHDEIDIEFLGKDTTKVQFNFFVNGKGGNEYMYDLGFDASEEFHTYGFRWEPDSITWFVDGKPVYKVTTDTSVQEAKNVRVVEALPQTAGRMLTNYWCGNERAWAWMGMYEGETRDNGTQYEWMGTSAEGAPLNSGSGSVTPDNPNPDNPNPDVNPSDPVKLDVEFLTDHKDIYTIEAPAQFADSARITYSAVVGNSWANVNTWIDGKIGGYDTLSFKIKNDGEAEVNIWLQLQNAGTNVAEEHLIIPAGEEKEFEISYSGNIQIALFFIDSSHVVTEGATYAGDITISEIKVAKKGATEDPDPTPDPEPTPDPDPVVGEYLEFKADPIYTLHNTEQYVNFVRVTYSGVDTKTYQNVNAWIKDKAAGKSEWTATVTNNGEATVYITLKLETEDHTALKEEKLEIAPGETKTLKSTFEGEAAFIYFFVDSGWSETVTTHSGDVVISGVAFSGEANTPNPDPEPTPDPDPTPDDSTSTPVTFEYWWASNTSLYSYEGSNPITIRYNGAGSGYACVGGHPGNYVAGKNVFTVTITNNGAAATKVRVDVQNGASAICNVSATAEGYDVETVEGSTLEIPAGESATLVITFNSTDGAIANIVLFVDTMREDSATYNSEIVLSDMSFSQK